MALEAHSQFHAFDWDNNAEWLSHKANLSFTDDSADALLKSRQKWFKTNINSQYDPSFKPTSSSTASEPVSSSTNEKPAPSERPSSEEKPKVNRTTFPLSRVFLMLMNILAVIHGAFAILNMVTPFFLGSTHFPLAYGHSAISYAILLFQAAGRPRLNMEYAKVLVSNDNMHYILYSMIFIANKPMPVSMFPIIIYSLINVSILLPRWLNSMAIPLGPVSTFSARIRELKPKMLALASNLEVAVFVALVIDVVMGDFSSLLPGLLYWNFLTQRWVASSWTRGTIQVIETACDSFLLSSKCPAVISGIYAQIKGFIKRAASPRNARPH